MFGRDQRWRRRVLELEAALDEKALLLDEREKQLDVQKKVIDNQMTNLRAREISLREREIKSTKDRLDHERDQTSYARADYREGQCEYCRYTAELSYYKYYWAETKRMRSGWFCDEDCAESLTQEQRDLVDGLDYVKNSLGMKS